MSDVERYRAALELTQAIVTAVLRGDDDDFANLAPSGAEQAAAEAPSDENERLRAIIGKIPQEQLARITAEVENEAAEAAGPEPGLAAPSVAENSSVQLGEASANKSPSGYPGLLEDGPPNPADPELDGDE